MKSGESAEFRNIGIIGAGTIGGSIALKLGSVGYRIFVDDASTEIMEIFRKVYGFHALRDHPLDDMDIVILATPMSVEEEILRTIEYTGPMMDVASVKKPFMDIANRRGLRLVGGHPMAGNNQSGRKGWDPEMFTARPFLLCEGEHTLPEDLAKVEKMVKDMGGKPMWLEVEEHDRIVSKVSQATYFISLMARILGNDYERFAGPGYESTTRLSHQNIDMVLDMVFYNRENILEDLKTARDILDEIISHIEEKSEKELLRDVM